MSTSIRRSLTRCWQSEVARYTAEQHQFVWAFFVMFMALSGLGMMVRVPTSTASLTLPASHSISLPLTLLCSQYLSQYLSLNTVNTATHTAFPHCIPTLLDGKSLMASPFDMIHLFLVHFSFICVIVCHQIMQFCIDTAFLPGSSTSLTPIDQWQAAKPPID